MEIARLAIIAVIVLFGIPLVAVIGGILLAMLKVTRGGPSHTDKKQQAEETGLIQEINDGLVRMEERIETLETLLFDRDEKVAGKKTDVKKADEDKTNDKGGQR